MFINVLYTCLFVVNLFGEVMLKEVIYRLDDMKLAVFYVFFAFLSWILYYLFQYGLYKGKYW